MKMFRLTHVFLLLGMLVATSQGAGMCSCSEIQASQENLKSDVKALQDLKSDAKALQDLKFDVKALQDLVEDLRTRRGDGLKWHQPPPSAPQSKVAFFVGLNQHLGPVSQNTDIVFDNVVTNICSAYSVSTGRFTAPVAGTYQFSVTVAAQNGKTAAVVLSKNGATVFYVYSVSTPWWAPSTEEAILWLNAGDQIWLQLLAGQQYVFGRMYTAFSGFLIF